MHIQRKEYANYTREQIEQHVLDALGMASKLGLSADERDLLLPAIFEKLTSKQVTLEAIDTLPNMVVPKGLG